MTESSPSDSELQLLQEIFQQPIDIIDKITFYVSQIKKWQEKTNLVSPTTLDTIWTRHIADSLQTVATMPDAKCWVDLGSGGGLPGIVIAIALAKRDATRVHLVESNGKKAAFLRHVSRELGLKAEIHAQRIESVAKQPLDAEVVTARALASLPKLLDLAYPLMKNGTGLFHKGRDYRRELEECSGLWKFDLVEHPSRIEPDSVLLEIRNLIKVGE